MRAVHGKEVLYDHIGFRQRDSELAVGVLETSRLPTPAAVAYLAGACEVAADRLTLIVARTASLAGGVQVIARSVETALHKLHSMGFDLSRIKAGFGSAPLPPVAGDDLGAVGRTNDAVLYGGQVTLYVTGDDESLEAAAEGLPSCASKDHGRPFSEIFAACHHDFYKIDPMLFSPAAVCLTNISTGNSFARGSVNVDLLRQSFFS
jgi:methenyltetrahydromethanopterin cyclohydrolase